MATENSTLFTKRPNGRYAPATRQNICEATATYAELPRRQKIHDLGAVASYLVAKFSHLEYEVFSVILLDNKHRIIECAELFRGTIDSTAVYPREVVKEALSVNAAAVIFAHNHQLEANRLFLKDTVSTNSH